MEKEIQMRLIQILCYFLNLEYLLSYCFENVYKIFLFYYGLSEIFFG